MDVKKVTLEIVKDYIDDLEVISPEAMARQNYHTLGLGFESNPYIVNTEDHSKFNSEIHRLQVTDLKQLMGNYRA